MNAEEIKLNDFCEKLHTDITDLLFKQKIRPQYIIGILHQAIYNISRTIETNKKLAKEIDIKWGV